MAWKGSTRVLDNGTRERRCGDKRHRGARWLPLSLVHFHSLSLHRCRVCHCRNARELWRANHPESQRRASPRRAGRAAHDLGEAMKGWVRA